jgi:type I restriction enzyme S subunit
MKTLRLGDVAEKIGSGATPRGGNSVYQTAGIALIRSQNVYKDGFHRDGLAFISDEHADELSNVEVRSGDVLLNITGDSVARVCQVPDEVLPARVNQHVAIIRPYPDKLDARFLRYFLTSPATQDYMLGLAAAGATRNALTKGMIEDFEIPAKPLPEQRAIAGVLGALDDKIELNRRMNETLEAIAKAEFRRMKEEGRDSTIGDEFNLTMGQSPPGNTYNETGNGIPFFQGRADFGFRYPTARVFCTAPTRFANAGDTLVRVRAPVGSVNMAAGKCCVGRGVAAVRHKSGSRSFTYYFMRSLEPEFARFEAEGTVFGSINKDGFQGLECVALPPEAVAGFEKFAFPIDQMIENNENESRTLAALRDALLPKLVSGAVRVKGLAE